MKSLIAVAVVLAVLPGGRAAVSPEITALLKCPAEAHLFPEAPDVVHVLDGRLLSEEEFRNLDVTTLESIEIACPRDVHRVFGIQSRRGAIVVFTAPGPKQVVQAALDSIATLQRNHFEARGAFASRLAELPWADETGMIAVELSASHGGLRWSATGRHRHFIRPDRAITVSGDRTAGNH